ncbi:4589_t:CDS:2, partial [Paraglomus brasilianum]
SQPLSQQTPHTDTTASDLTAFLTSCGLTQYQDKFIENGYTNMSNFTNYEPDDISEMANVINLLPGHKADLKVAIQKLKESTAANGAHPDINFYIEPINAIQKLSTYLIQGKFCLIKVRGFGCGLQIYVISFNGGIQLECGVDEFW